MSTFKTPYFNDIPLNYSILQTQNVLVGNLTINGWQLVAQVDGSYSDVITPTTETIGTATFREVVRIYFPDNTTIKIGSYQVCIANAFAQSIRVTALTGGAVRAGVTINGVTVLGAVGGAGATANDNLRALYYALRDSVDVTITGWSYDYQSTGKPTDLDTIICTNKTIAANVVCSGNANVTYAAHATSVLTGARSGYANVDVNYAYGVTMDLTNGFVYFMDVFSRSFKLSTKCLSGFYGPIFASYADHTEALAVTPPGGFCTPMELWVGTDAATNGTATARPTHWWGVGTKYATLPVSNVQTTTTFTGNPVADAHPFTCAIASGQITDVNSGHSTNDSFAVNGGDPVVFAEMGWPDYSGDTVGSRAVSPYKLVSVTASSMAYYTNAPYSFSYRFIGSTNLPDVYKWHGTEPNEASSMGQVQPAPTNYPTLTQALDATTAYTTFTVSSTALLNAAGGGLIIGTEEFTYTGLGVNSVTGVLRAQNGTVAARHFSGDIISIVTWYLKLNGGAHCAGPNKPV